MASYGGKNGSQTTQITKNSASEKYNPQLNKPTTGLFNNQPAPARLTVPQKDLLVFFRQLSVILQSGVAIAQGMILIAENMTNRTHAHAVQDIAGRLTTIDQQ